MVDGASHHRVRVESGQQLSRLGNQDSYSYEIANLFLGAGSERALLEHHRRYLGMMSFRFSGPDRW